MPSYTCHYSKDLNFIIILKLFQDIFIYLIACFVNGTVCLENSAANVFGNTFQYQVNIYRGSVYIEDQFYSVTQSNACIFRVNEELRKENFKLREDNTKLFSKAVEDRDKKIADLDRKIWNMKEQTATMESRYKYIEQSQNDIYVNETLFSRILFQVQVI